MKFLLILPHQLYNFKIIKKAIIDYDIRNIVIWECPFYFTRMNFNKKKLILHRASMKYYFDVLSEKVIGSKIAQIQYLEFNHKLRVCIFDEKAIVHVFDPIDNLKRSNFGLSREQSIKFIQTPNFILENYDDYPIRKKYAFNHFYMWGKAKSNIIPLVKSQDLYNRERLPKEDIIDDIFINPDKNEQTYINAAIHYIELNFPNNIGNSNNFNFPITHESALKQLKLFITKKFKKFGSYQDAVCANKLTLYHSFMSSSINIGLINPLDVVKIISQVKDKIPINSYEGFVRQLFWREYQRMTYIRIFSQFAFMKAENYFGNTKSLTGGWYNGTLGIEPVDNAIKRGIDNAYLHHIERLMVVGNFMNLSGISPQEGHRWFMEFSIDSYDWVMGQNVYDMVFFCTRMTAYKPYISSSNYILKMSDYKKGEWCEEWDKLYHHFLKKHKAKLWPYRYHFPSLSSL